MSTENQTEAVATPVESEPVKPEPKPELLPVEPEHKPSKLLAPEKKRRRKRKAKAAVKAAPKKVAKKRKPTTGQSAPPIESLLWDDLNKKEKLVLGSFELKGEREVRTIEGLAAEAFRTQTRKKANSWVRNCLRRLIRADWLEKVKPGEYRLSPAGRRKLVRADA